MAAKLRRIAGSPDTPLFTSREVWLLLGLLLIATTLAYQPVWHGGMLWDDNRHLTRAALASGDGLFRIWFDVGATSQYYPLTHTVFWLLHWIAGGDTLAYHLANILLHVCSACLFAVILRRLAIPGAALAALVFAVHPVHAESVAWMSELKNTLSGVWYLAAAFAYLRFDATRRRAWYASAFGLFILALLSKTVTATLPAGLLVVFWWQRGRLDWRRDIWPLVPFVAVGAAAGLFTAWVERTVVGASGTAFQFSIVERALIAGRALWFYLGKLVWPVDLVFVYPRWQVDQDVWWQYAYPAGMVLLAGILWTLRARSRAPLAALLLFAGTLFPALGFFNVYPFQYAFVADHFQYLASLGIISLISAGIARLAMRWPSHRMSVAVASAVVAPLAVLTWMDAHQYVNEETLYRTILSRNPACWMAYNNLGDLKLHGSATEIDEAIRHFKQALVLRPDYPEAHNNLGCAWQKTGRMQEAIAQHEEAARLKPDYTEAYYNLGLDLQALGQFEKAAARYRQALALAPDFVAARHNLAVVLQATGQVDQAIAEFSAALRTEPTAAIIHFNLGSALQHQGRLDEAVVELQQALRLQPDEVPARFQLANLLKATGHLEEAVAQYQETLRRAPKAGAAPIHNELGVALAKLGDGQGALTHFKDAVRIDPAHAGAQDNLAKALRLMAAEKK